MWSYSGNGDHGTSSTYSRSNVPKSSGIFEVLGTLDEITAFIGLALSFANNKSVKETLERLLKDISELMGIISREKNTDQTSEAIISNLAKNLEEEIEYYGNQVENPQRFTFGGKTRIGAVLDVLRAITRRAERAYVRYHDEVGTEYSLLLAYLNRLSSLFYIIRLYSDQLGTE